ncbi:MAG TPA: hypothetical protein DEP07_07320 [Brevibacillus sp.]|nr:hypothetical protein [Brevibacillus sp.]
MFGNDENMIVYRQKKKRCACIIRQSLLAAFAMMTLYIYKDDRQVDSGRETWRKGAHHDAGKNS